MCQRIRVSMNNVFNIAQIISLTLSKIVHFKASKNFSFELWYFLSARKKGLLPNSSLINFPSCVWYNTQAKSFPDPYVCNIKVCSNCRYDMLVMAEMLNNSKAFGTFFWIRFHDSRYLFIFSFSGSTFSN